MGLYYNFFVQQRRRDGWIVPKGFTNRLRGYQEDLGYFVWFKQAPLFFGNSAKFRLDTNQPPGIEHTLLYQRLDYGFHDWYRGWIAFEDLLLDIWADSHVFIPSHVPAHLAIVFADGAQPFPAQQLADRGCLADKIADIRGDYPFKMVDRPVVPGSGTDDFRRRLVKVSWKMSIADFLGDWRVSEFQKLREFGEDSDLRIICTHS